MENIKKQLIKQVGKQCKDYSPFCYTCIVWNAYNTLNDVLKIGKKIDEIKR